MPKKLFEMKRKGHISKFVLSNDWFSFKPWSHKDQPIPYVWKTTERSESGDVDFTYIYVGPFALISGKWVSEE